MIAREDNGGNHAMRRFRQSALRAAAPGSSRWWVAKAIDYGFASVWLGVFGC